ncbi:MAG: thiamine-phosphate kinase [Gemmatimonadales bacterium]
MTDDGRDRPEPVAPPTTSGSHAALGEGREFDAIRRMLDRWGPRARAIGDDAAVIEGIRSRKLVASIDTSVENVHFMREWLSPAETGYRAATAALSDLAAMGAEPLGILAAIGLPDSWLHDLDGIADGIGEAAAFAAAPILGGDLSSATELTLTFTVLGAASSPLLRTSAHPGDRVYVTGRLGGSLAALRALQQGLEPLPEHRSRFARPVARLREAVWLSRHGANAAIDISDGLRSDLEHIAAASGVTLVIDLDRLPTLAGLSPIDAAQSGEEYEIVVMSSRDIDAAAFQKRFGVALSRIGNVESGPSEVRFVADGKPVQVPRGYLHFGH